jgi:hypothetical protein
MLVASSNKSILLCTRLVWKPISRERERERERANLLPGRNKTEEKDNVNLLVYCLVHVVGAHIIFVIV